MGLKENSGVDISLIAADFVFVLREGIGRDASEAPRQMLGEGLLDLREFCPLLKFADREWQKVSNLTNIALGVPSFG